MKSPKDVDRWGRGAAVTLHQVAQRAGVHPMTVSRALKGSDKVAPATRETIERIARELNYTPNMTARALVMGKTSTIAVVTGPVSEYYYAHLLHLLEMELEASNYKMLFLRSRDLNQDLLSIVSAHAVDGVIAIDASPDISELLQLQQARDSENTLIPPLAYAGVVDQDWEAAHAVDAIKVDLNGGIRDALNAMLRTGSQRIAYLVANAHMGSTAEVRARVYTAIMREAGRPCEIINLEIGGDTSDRTAVRHRLVTYLKQHGSPDGLLCQNDEMAIPAYRALRDLGLRVPDDVQLVGCDGLPYMEYFDPQLSTIVQPGEEMCALAWQFLQNRLANPHAPHQEATLHAHLEVRASLRAFREESPPSE